jgi:asparagine synthase (glutamine-hydrolysing)
MCGLIGSLYSGSETLVAGLAQRGPAILLELRGMFAFAAYETAKEQLLLARDRLGTSCST